MDRSREQSGLDPRDGIVDLRVIGTVAVAVAHGEIEGGDQAGVESVHRSDFVDGFDCVRVLDQCHAQDFAVGDISVLLQADPETE